ncbi:6-phosphofructokinase [Dethiosulfatibacter aminovorans DSM 17477]|uniref:ATP-dependent 6-phosphofructokinase n=1 Tax=Dethiosulfatibacter aminovorans DSM 17477 TaxID=1121476 RepID=A0A1M6L354_9FIRM|nr:6-phosphofructokinase [Dethiosulfatibacter aminovorans]SHJ65612.1 6-phosphofructokinase [Dethiosulfatibacter aminovorans DSM 17477]
MRRIGVLTSGGDAPGMNAAIRAVVRYAIYRNIEVLGIKKGYKGLIENDIKHMDLSSVADIIHRGGTILGTDRCEEFKTEEGFNKALDNIRYRDIDGIIVIGGDGSFQGARKLSLAGIPTIGIPGTIDNDLAYTEYTLGFNTALNTILDSISKIRDTSSSHERTNIIEVMGRNCGDLALYSGLAGGAEVVIIPEAPIDMDTICETIMRGKARGKKHSIIMLAEGSGNAYELKDAITNKFDVNIRCTVLGYIQRGGTPSAYDRLLGSRLGAKGAELLVGGTGNVVLGTKDNVIFNMDIDEALKIEKQFDYEAYELTKILSM